MASSTATTPPSTVLPRVTIQFCTQCKWMLRAAYFAQELLSTFGNDLGEVALQPSTGGTFVVRIYHVPTTATAGKAVEEGGAVEGEEKGELQVKEYLLWDRKVEGGFPEAKELKKRVRDIIDPTRNLGHVDGKKQASTPNPPAPASTEIQTQISQLASAEDVNFHSLKGNNAIATVNPGEKDEVKAGEVEERKGSSEDGKKENEKTEEKEVVNSRGLIVIGGNDGFGFCRPGEDCEDCG